MKRIITFVLHKLDRAGNVKYDCYLQCSHRVEFMARKKGRKDMAPEPAVGSTVACPTCERMVREEQAERNPPPTTQRQGLPPVRRRW
jgi:hypothetical protein